VRNYQIYWIEESFANHYYGRERMFFGLFSDWEKSSGELNELISKQVEFVTKPIPYLPTQRILQHEMVKVEGAKWIDTTAIIEAKDSGANLSQNERSISIEAWGPNDCEYLFFEILRRNMGRLLAIDLQNERYGWLKPIKQRKFIY
jgi:Sporulation inhibitor of replication protein SirA